MVHCFANSLEIDMEHISIPEGISDKLKGKTIEKTSLHTSMNHSDENHLVITFTDGTYISVVIESDDDYYLDEYIEAAISYVESYGYIDDLNKITIDDIKNYYIKYLNKTIDKTLILA